MGVMPPMPKLFAEKPRRYYTKMWEVLKKERNRLEPVYEDIADYIIPFVNRVREGERRKYGQGQRRTQRVRPSVINNKATIAHRNLVSNLMSGLTSPSRGWLVVGIGPDPIAKQYNVKRWLQGVTQTIAYILSASNYYQAQRVVYRDIVLYGTGPKIIDEDEDTVAHFVNIANGSYVLDVDAKGYPNRIMYELEMSVEAMVEKFGYDRLSRDLQIKYDEGNLQHVASLIRVIEPNRLFQDGKYGFKGMKFCSLYYETCCDGDWDKLLGLKGYYEQPFSAPRWDLLANDTYGISCAMETIGDIKALQHLELRKSQAIDKQVTPPTQGPPSGSSGGRISHLPGKHTSVSEQGAGIRPLYEVRPDMISLTNEIARHEDRIDRAFFTDLLTGINNLGDTPNVKAAQINGMQEERMMAFGPVVERLFGEMLDVDIRRVYSIARRAGIIPPPPPEIADRNIRMTYTGPFAQLQKAIGIGNIERTLSMVSQTAATYPEAADKINADRLIDEYTDAIGSPANILNSDAEIQALRQSRQQQIQQKEAAHNLAAGAEVAKTASETQITDPSMLSYLIGGAAG